MVFKKEKEDSARDFDETFSRTMRKMWVQFTKTGDPSLGADIFRSLFKFVYVLEWLKTCWNKFLAA